MKKILYTLVRTLSVFGLPGLRVFRNYIYQVFFSAEGIRVSDRVLITTAHMNEGAFINIGKGVEFGRDAYIDYSGGVTIGSFVAISEGAKIFTHNHVVKTGHSNWHRNPIEFSNLHISDDVWIGAAAIVLPRVKTIGRGAVIGAGAVLGRDADEYGIYVGNPAKLVGYRNIIDANLMT